MLILHRHVTVGDRDTEYIRGVRQPIIYGLSRRRAYVLAQDRTTRLFLPEELRDRVA